MDTMPFTEEKKIFAKVQDISDYHRLDPKERVEYDAALKRYRDYNLTILTAKQEGEIKKNLENAKSMRNLGVDINIICQVTGLSEAQIKNL